MQEQENSSMLGFHTTTALQPVMQASAPLLGADYPKPIMNPSSTIQPHPATNGFNGTYSLESDALPASFASLGDIAHTTPATDMSSTMGNHHTHNMHHTPSATSFADDASMYDGSYSHQMDNQSMNGHDNDDHERQGSVDFTSPYQSTSVQSNNTAITKSESFLDSKLPFSGEHAASNMATDSLLLFKDQIKWFSGLTRNMRKRKDAVIFLVPVDPIALNIPTYSTVIKQPMDISTIDKKLQNKGYSDVATIKADFELMFNNCYTFNGADSQVSVMAKNLQAWYHKELEKLPLTFRPPVDRKPKPPHRESLTGGENRPKREQHSLTREQTPSASKKNKPRKVSPELKFCSYIQRELSKKHHSPYNLPFLVPVDPIALGIPHYRSIITRPMDLSTMRKKLDNGDYEHASEFEADMRLMLNNCYTFNPPGTDVYNLGKRLEGAFNNKWTEKASFLAQHDESAAKLQKTKSAFSTTPHTSSHRPHASSIYPTSTPTPASRPANQAMSAFTPTAKPPTAAKAPFQSAQHDQAKTQKPSRHGKPLSAAYTPASASAIGSGSKSRYDDTDSSSEEDADTQHIEMLQTQLNLLNTQLQMLTDKRNKKRKRRSHGHVHDSAEVASPPEPVAQSSAKSRSRTRLPAPKPDRRRSITKRARPNDSDDENEPEEITYEQKRELSESIDLLPHERLCTVLEIIKENAQLNTTGEEEIVLDIDSLDKSVLWKLYKFVRKHTRSISKPATEVAKTSTVAPPTSITPMKQGNESSSSSGSDSDGSDIFSDIGAASDADFEAAGTLNTIHHTRSQSITRSRSTSVSHSETGASAHITPEKPLIHSSVSLAPSLEKSEASPNKSRPVLLIRNPYLATGDVDNTTTQPPETIASNASSVNVCSAPATSVPVAARPHTTKGSKAEFRVEKGDVTAWTGGSTTTGQPGKFSHRPSLTKSGASGFFSKGSNSSLNRRSSSFIHTEALLASTVVKEDITGQNFNANPTPPVLPPRKPRYDSVLDSAWDHHKSLRNPEKEAQERRKQVEAIEKAEKARKDAISGKVNPKEASVDHNGEPKRSNLDGGDFGETSDVSKRRLLNEQWIMQQQLAAEIATACEQDILARSKSYENVKPIDLQGPGDSMNAFYATIDNMESIMTDSKTIRDVFRKEAVDEVGRVAGPWAFYCELSSSDEDEYEDIGSNIEDLRDADMTDGASGGAGDSAEEVESDNHEVTDMDLD
ncbi:hypothetical protein RTP6_005781 [Batrachochytrium dendrobatidis]